MDTPPVSRNGDVEMSPELTTSVKNPTLFPSSFSRRRGHLWSLKFDTPNVERQFQSSTLSKRQYRFASACLFQCLLSVVWLLYVVFTQMTGQWLPGIILLLFTTVMYAGVFGAAWLKPLYRLQLHVISCGIFVIVSLLLLGVSISSSQAPVSVGPIAVIYVCIILLLYTCIPLQLYVLVAVALAAGALFEVPMYLIWEFPISLLPARLLLHIVLHFVGIYIHIRQECQLRETFLCLANAALQEQDMTVEKQLKETMIYSIMPKAMAQKKQSTDSALKRYRKSILPKSEGKEDRGTEFKDLMVDRLENVSIIFADIVGFTKMSSNKTATNLVGLLDDLFGRFDRLCVATDCEKIATLGDCYYCVSGCPEPREDHAQSCVEMGLGMVRAIEMFDVDFNEEVGMRVGVHTGAVLAGIVGGCRFKFDVWSNDTTLANEMESSGEAGRVHISHDTYEFVKNDYDCEPGEQVPDTRVDHAIHEYYDKEKQRMVVNKVNDCKVVGTWFIIGRKPGMQHQKLTDTNEMPSEPESHLLEDDGYTDIGGIGDARTSKAKDTHLTASLIMEHRSHTDPPMAGAENDSTGAFNAEAARDLLLVSAVRQAEREKVKMFVTPAVNPISLQFTSDEYESDYRSHFLEPYNAVSSTTSPRHLSLVATSVIFVSTLIFVFCSYLGFTITAPAIIVTAIVIIAPMPLILSYIFYVRSPINSKCGLPLVLHRFPIYNGWSLLAAVLPAAFILSNLSCELFSHHTQEAVFLFALAVSLVIFLVNPITIYYLRVLFCFLALVLAAAIYPFLNDASCFPVDPASNSLNSSLNTTSTPTPDTTSAATPSGIDNSTADQIEWGAWRGPLYTDRLFAEFIVALSVLFLLFVFLIRETELNWRHNWYSSLEAAVIANDVKEQTIQTDWLLSNIIPAYISAQFRENKAFSENHKNVGVVFASIKNFSDFYDEQFEGGAQNLKVLNEIFHEFESLLSEPRFKDVEKIKTIASCLMVASGLDTVKRNKNQDPKAHLYALLQFCEELIKKMKEFNAQMFSFHFQLYIGFNFGEVTSGVIGRTKLHYDIWGDTVNVSSRMYSTGDKMKIQVTEVVADALSEKFDFVHRGVVAVKGKGDMRTSLLVNKKKGASWS